MHFVRIKPNESEHRYFQVTLNEDRAFTLMTLSTHVLDTARGAPGAGIAVTLYALEGSTRRPIAQAETNEDGRTVPALGTDLAAGTYELVFSVGPYFERSSTPAFYDEIAVRVVLSESERYHVPLLLTPWSYTTYRGS